MHNPDSLRVVKTLKQSDHQQVCIVEDTDGKRYLKREISGDKREIYKTLQKINHPNIPKIYYVALTDHTTVIEEYIDGTSLDVWMEQNVKINKKHVRLIVKQVLSALEKLHKENILHRDIKPDNILIDQSYHIWLIDYDIARIHRNEIRKDTELMGTFGYAPIEQYGMLPTDFTTDIYAFGVTLKTLLDYSKIKGYLNKIADKCKRLDPSQRYRSVKAIKKAMLLTSNKALVTYCIVLLIVLLGVLRFAHLANTEQVSQPEVDNRETTQQNDIVTDKDTQTTDDEDTYKQSGDNYIFEGEFAEFILGQTEKEYGKYANYPSVSIFSTDEPYTHLLFLEDMNKKGKIKFGKDDAIISADVTLSSGILTVSLSDEKGRVFNQQFKYSGQYEYDKMYSNNLRKNADIICYDLDGDGYKELLIGLNECAIGIFDGMIQNRFNYCIAWCIRYDEVKGFTLCEGSMFSEEQPFQINAYAQKLNVPWREFGDITGYYLEGNSIEPTF